MNRQELINDNTNKQVLNQVIKQHLTDFVIEYNAEVSEQRVPGEGWLGQLCARDDLFAFSFQTKDLIYELQVLNHMLLFVSKSSRSSGMIMQHYKLAAKKFQNKVCGSCHCSLGLFSFFLFFLFFLLFFFFCFLGLHTWHMEVPRLGGESELQLPAYTTATAT